MGIEIRDSLRRLDPRIMRPVLPPDIAAGGALGKDALVSSHSRSPWRQQRAVGGTPVDVLPEVPAREAKLGEYGVFDNVSQANLSPMGQQMRQRVEAAGPLEHVAFVSQTADPVDGMTMREKDARGNVPVVKLGPDKQADGSYRASDPANLQDFVANHLYGKTGGASAGPHDLLLEDHGGAYWGWGETPDHKMMGWPQTIDAIKAGLPAGQKLRALLLNMCMTGGSSEAVVEAARKGVADVMIGNEDLGLSGGFNQQHLLQFLDAHPAASGEDLLRFLMKDGNPRSVDTHADAFVGVTLDPAKVQAYSDAFKQLSDVLKTKGTADPALKQGLRKAFADARPPILEQGPDDFRNRDVRELMQEIRTNVKDPEIAAATRKVDATHDALVLVHAENRSERRAGRGLSVNAPIRPSADGKMHLDDGGWKGQSYHASQFDQLTGWSGVLQLVNSDQLAVEQARAAIAANQGDQAVSLFKQALADNPGNHEARVELANLLSKRPEAAQQTIDTAKGLYRHFAFGTLQAMSARADLGDAYLAKGDTSRAIAQYGGVLDQMRWLRGGNGYTFYASLPPGIDQAAQYARFETIASKLRDMLVQQADAALQAKRPGAAIKPLQRALDAADGDLVQQAQISERLREVYQRTGKHDLAEQETARLSTLATLARQAYATASQAASQAQDALARIMKLSGSGDPNPGAPSAA